MGRQGEGGGLKILKNEETSFMDDPLAMVIHAVTLSFQYLSLGIYLMTFFNQSQSYLMEYFACNIRIQRKKKKAKKRYV